MLCAKVDCDDDGGDDAAILWSRGKYIRHENGYKEY